jgi:hypothetical protein
MQTPLALASALLTQPWGVQNLNAPRTGKEQAMRDVFIALATASYIALSLVALSQIQRIEALEAQVVQLQKVNKLQEDGITAARNLALGMCGKERQ